MGSAQLKSLINIRRSMSKSKIQSTVIGFVSNDGDLHRSYCFSNSNWEPTSREPTAFFAESLEPVFLRPKRFIVIVGGRGSGKSIGIGDAGLIQMHDMRANLLCIREFQSSIEDSVHGLLREEVSRLELKDFTITDKRIQCATGGYAKFSGLSRNPESVKSAFGFKWFWVEEAQFLSDKSLKTLTPTARNKPVKGLPAKMVEVDVDEIDLDSVSVVFTGNPASSDDPFSKRFLVPFQSELDAEGIYEDDMHLIIKMNWNDNPWYKLSGLNAEREFDYTNLPRSTYDWIWNGGYNDDIENALIKSEWFDACIDAHKKLFPNAHGITKVTHDPSDLGADPKAVLVRKGNVITNVTQRTDIDVNEGNDWALGIAINENADQYEWDVGGMGVTLKRDVNTALEGKRITTHQFNGASSVDNPDTPYEASGASNIRNDMTWKEVCKNLRAQCYLRLRDRIYRTYLSVTKGVMCDPDMLISISSDCEHLSTLRSELCRMPIKPNSSGLFELYTKKEMREKFKVRSPNLADCLMMSERQHGIINNDAPFEIPNEVNYW